MHSRSSTAVPGSGIQATWNSASRAGALWLSQIEVAALDDDHIADGDVTAAVVHTGDARGRHLVEGYVIPEAPVREILLPCGTRDWVTF